MSDRRVLVCFLDRAASWVERQGIDDDIIFLSSSGGYESCLLCYDCVECRTWAERLDNRLRGKAAAKPRLVEFAIGRERLTPWLDASLFTGSGDGRSVDVLHPRVDISKRTRLIEAGMGDLEETYWVRVSGSANRRIERTMMGRRDGPGFVPKACRPDPSDVGERMDAYGSGEEPEGLIARISRFDDVGVLIQGETGTGKTRLARRIHADGPRSRGPLVEVNCACIPSGMIESELFGHVRGAYTGAALERLGKIRAADGGTLFLDEVGELGLDIQVRLLKVLEDGAVIPLGSERPIKVDVRVIAATNRDLMAMVKAGQFRFDLFSRLNQVCVKLPPIRGRRTEIVEVAERTLRQWNDAHGEMKVFTAAAIAALEEGRWPGNYRQLMHAVHCACIRSGGGTIEPFHLPLNEWEGPPAAEESLPSIPEGGINLKEVLSCQEWAYYKSALMQSGWRPGCAARLLGMTAHAFRKALRERHAQRYQEMMREEGAEEA